MITGRVNSKLEPIVALNVYGADSGIYSVPAVVDTGFGGDLIMPELLIRRFGFRYLQRRAKIRMAAGKTVRVKLYEGAIEWQDTRKDVSVLGMGNETLLGMNLLRISKLTIHRDTITIE